MLALCLFALVGWQGITTVGRGGAVDAGEHVRYAQYLDAHARPPAKSQNYEFATPPLFHASAILLQRALRSLPSRGLEFPSNWVTRALWLALAAGGVLGLTRPSRRERRLAAGVIGLAGLWGLNETASLVKTEPWVSGQLLALLAGIALIVLSSLIAREVWPGHVGRALVVGGLVAGYPVVYRMSILFHPEMLLAAICAAALLITLRAERYGWPLRLGYLLGALCGLGVWTRQPALLIAACLGAAALAAGGRRAVPFLVRAVVVFAVVAGPWFGYAYRTWHNPLQSNLEPRASLMLDHQPASFYVSVPIDVVLHPYRPHFSNELLPKLHAELWSDWFGAIHPFSSTPSRLDRVTASTQSVFGLVPDILGLAGLIALGIPAAARIRRRGTDPDGASSDRASFGLGVLGLVTTLALGAFVLMLLRFPQRDGDPIKSSYLLFTAPAWAVFAVAVGVALLKRWRIAGRVFVVLAALYAVSYTADLTAALSHGAGDRPIAGLAGVVDLSTVIQQTSPSPGIGGEVDFLVGVDNHGNQTADGITLTVDLPAAARLVGPPFYERGGGCVGSGSISCNLGFIAGGSSTLIRFGVLIVEGGPQTLVATVTTTSSTDRDPSNDATSFTVDLGPFG